MIRLPAVAAGLVALAVAGCSPAAEQESGVLKAVLASASTAFETDALCLRPKLIERRNAWDFGRWAFMPAKPPRGFEALDTPQRGTDHQFGEKHVPLNIANRWRVSADEKDLCIVLTIPVIIGDRALVSLSFDMPASGRMNYWLRRVDGGWRVAELNEDHHDI